MGLAGRIRREKGHGRKIQGSQKSVRARRRSIHPGFRPHDGSGPYAYADSPFSSALSFYSLTDGSTDLIRGTPVSFRRWRIRPPPSDIRGFASGSPFFHAGPPAILRFNAVSQRSGLGKDSGKANRPSVPPYFLFRGILYHKRRKNQAFQSETGPFRPAFRSQTLPGGGARVRPGFRSRGRRAICCSV